MAESHETHAHDLMSTPLVTCGYAMPLGEVAALLNEQHIHALVVLDGAGRPAGIVSDTDLLTGEWLAVDASSLETMRAFTAGEIMSTPLVAVDVDATLAAVVRTMQQERVARLVVTRESEPMGVVSVSDLVRRLAQISTTRASVADVMSRGLVVCREGTTVSDAARAMTDRRSRAVIIVNRHGHTLGMASGFDLLRAFDESTSADMTVDELMRPPVTIAPEATLRAAADLMLTHETHRLVVVDSNEPGVIPLGLISTSDIVAEMATAGSAWRT